MDKTDYLSFHVRGELERKKKSESILENLLSWRTLFKTARERSEEMLISQGFWFEPQRWPQSPESNGVRGKGKNELDLETSSKMSFNHINERRHMLISSEKGERERKGKLLLHQNLDKYFILHWGCNAFICWEFRKKYVDTNTLKKKSNRMNTIIES